MENRTRFTPEQVAALNAQLDQFRIKTREGKFSYITGSDAIATANRIFGFDGWSSEVLQLTETNRELVSLGNKEQWRVSYIAQVRVTLIDSGVSRVDVGFGSGFGKPGDIGAAIEKAVKEATTDALKRALRTFGDQFGLSLYDPSQAPTGDPTDYGAMARRTIGKAIKDYGLTVELIKTALRDGGLPDDSTGYFVDDQVRELEKVISNLTTDTRYRARIEQQTTEV